MGHAWSVLCPKEERAGMVEALRTIDGLAECEFAQDASELRERMAECASGERSALIGLSKSGVSDVNLAAAIASDGHAEKVVLALRSPSGSLRSRAARAGIDLVVDLDGVSPAPSAEMDAAPVPEPLQNSDGGRTSAAPGPALAPEGARAPILTFCSGRGGVGKTSVVACAAVAAASWGMRVEVVDLDLSCGNLYAMVGLARGTDLSRLSAEDLGDAEHLGRLGAPCGERIRVWGPCERPETSELVSGIVSVLLGALALDADLVLVDTSPTFSEAVALAVRQSDRVVLVHDSRPGSLAALARTSGLPGWRTAWTCGTGQTRRWAGQRWGSRLRVRSRRSMAGTRFLTTWDMEMRQAFWRWARRLRSPLPPAWPSSSRSLGRSQRPSLHSALPRGLPRGAGAFSGAGGRRSRCLYSRWSARRKRGEGLPQRRDATFASSG